MYTLVKMLLSLVILMVLAGLADAQLCPEGDLNGDCGVDSRDLRLLAQRWLDPNCLSPDCPAELDGVPGVDMSDYALFAGNWAKGFSEYTLVINEFMAENDGFVKDPYGDKDDWIEIYNYGEEAIDIGGMYLTDDLLDLNDFYQIPHNDPEVTTIGAHEFLLIWADGEPREGALHIGFKLDKNGEDIGLYESDKVTRIDAIDDFPQQYSNESYGRYPDGNDNWMVFLNPTPGSANMLEPIGIRINEIMYHPYHSTVDPIEPENLGEEYIELINIGTQLVRFDGWRFSNGIDFAFPNDVTIDVGQYLVIAADVNDFKAKYPTVTNFIGGWTGRLSNSGEEIKLVDDMDITIDRVHYYDEGDWAVRKLGPVDFFHRGWMWSNDHDGDGKSLELINPNMSNNQGQNWAASLNNGGTPGTINSRANSNIPPIILRVEHRPRIPGPNDPVTVTADIVDEQAAASSVLLFYRVDGSPSFNALLMYDDGAHGDDEAGDGEWGGQIPPQSDGKVIEFYIRANDSSFNMRYWPAPADVDGTPQQVANALYQVDASFDQDAVWIPGSQPIYYIIMTEAERAELEDIGDTNLDGQTGFASEAMSNAQMNATFTSFDGVDAKTRYNVGVRNRGNRNRYDPPNNYRVNFKHDDPWKDVTALNLNTKYTHLQLMGSWLFQMSGVTAANAAPVQVRVNGENLAMDDFSSTNGSYIALENYDGEWPGNHIPDDDAGNVYRCTYYDNGIDPRTFADLDYKSSIIEYRENYPKQTNVAQDDYSDLLNLIDKLNNPAIPDTSFISDVNQVLDLKQWARFFAADALAGNREGGLTDGTGDDYAMYCGIIDPRFWLLPHDLDTMLGQGDHDYRPDWPIFNYAGVDGLTRLFNQPEFIKLYYNQYNDLIHTLYELDNVYPLVDRMLDGWASDSEINGSNGIKEFIEERVNSILYGGYPNSGDPPQIPQQFTINSSLPVVDGFPQTNTNVTSLNGTFNAIETSSVKVNGQLVAGSDYSQRNGTWSINNIALNPGINRIIVQAFDGPSGTGNEVERGYIDIWYNTGSTNDYPKGTGGGGARSSQDIIASAAQSVRMIVRDSYLPGVPVLVRVEVLGDDNNIDRDLWDATAILSSNNPGVYLSTNQVTLYNGLGSAFVTFTGGGNFTLTVDVAGLQTSAALTDWSGQTVNTVSGSLSSSATWSGIYHITGGDYSIPAGVTLTLNPGTLVLIDGVSSGTDGIDIDVVGSIRSLGTASSPVTFTAYNTGQNWGELHHEDAEPSVFQYTNITQGGHSPPIGHSNSGPTFRVSDSTLVFDYSSLTDNAGKLMDVTSGSDLTFRDCLFARSVMGPEISGTALLFEDSWITDMHAGDDADGIYIHGQQPGQLCTLIRGVAANIVDDGIDTLSSEVTVEDFIVRDCNDKGISVYGGETTIDHCLVVETNRNPEDPTVAAIAAKSHEGATTIVNIDKTTIVATKTSGVTDYGIQSHNKYGVSTGTIIWNVTNSIIDATDPVNVQAPYLESDVHISYSDVYGEIWPGIGNINLNPQFVDKVNSDYNLHDSSPCIDAGDPAADPDPDLTVTDQGYYWFDQETPNLPDGSLTENTVWTPELGPYRIIGELTVPFGITLTIMPGTTVYFDTGTKLLIEGRLVAEGTQYELIRFTRTPGTGTVWNGLQFVNTLQDNRITYAVIEHGRTLDGMVGLDQSKLLLDNVTLDNTDRRRISTQDSSLIVRNCTFTNIFEFGEEPTGDNICEHIWGAAPATGYFIIENNIFGTITGHNDAIDVDGNARPAPVIQILNNLFLGGGDDALDLEGDAHIEGNVFMHYHKDEFNTGSGNANIISAGDAHGVGHDYVMVRNVFYDMDHVAQVKSESFMTFVNNTVVGVDVSALYFLRPTSMTDYGRGAYVDGSIFWDTETIFDRFTDTTDLTINRSIVSSDWQSYGTGNIDADPILVDPNTDRHLKSMSPAIGNGPWGLDMGAYVPAGAAICGEPDGITYHTDATLIVGGPGITHYNYCINDPNGPWSAELDVNVPIELTGLVNGNSYTVYAVGKNSAGVWQDQSSPTASRKWTVDTSYMRLVINEVLAHTYGIDPDIVELYYDGPAPLDLTGMSLTDNPKDPNKFVFSSSTVTDPVMNPGEYIVLYGDPNTGVIDNLGFALSNEGEGLYLYDKPAFGGNLIDSVDFGPQIEGFSIGRIGYGGVWKLNQPTLGQANIAQPLGDPAKLKINEWLANEQVLFNDDFIELYNPEPVPVELSGLYLTDNPVTQPAKQPISPLSFVSANGYSVFVADDSNKPGHVDFRLSADNEIIGLFDAQLNEIEKVFYGSQTTDASEGRTPNGANNIEFFVLPTPHVANPAGPTLTVTNLIAIDDEWSYEQSNTNLYTAWRAVGYDDSSWPTDDALFYVESASLPAPKNTPLTLGPRTFYFRKHFNLDVDPNLVTSFDYSTVIDDGAVVYINGNEVLPRIGMEEGIEILFSTLSERSVGDADYESHPPIPANYFVKGDNVIAVEVHQTSDTSTDVVFGLELDAVVMTYDESIDDLLALLDGLRITEIMYHAPNSPEYDYIELQNVGDVPLDMNGVRFTDGIDYIFPDMTLDAGEYVVVVSNQASFTDRYGTSGIDIAGEYAGELSNGGEDILLRLPWPYDAAILRFNYNDAWYPTTDGLGNSLEIINPAAKPATWDDKESWQAALPSPGGP